VDALVLVGTLEGPPKGFVSFEHEEDFELFEQTRLLVCKRVDLSKTVAAATRVAGGGVSTAATATVVTQVGKVGRRKRRQNQHFRNKYQQYVCNNSSI
jgi:hypothetical protein